MANLTSTAVVGESSAEPASGHAETVHSSTPVYKDWHTETNPPFPWSTDWAKWQGLPLFHESVDGSLKVDKLFKEVYNVLDTVEPLAYMMGTSEDIYFFFTAGGRYYFYNDGDLYLGEEEFRSREHFLEETLPESGTMPGIRVPAAPGTDLSWLYM